MYVIEYRKNGKLIKEFKTNDFQVFRLQGALSKSIIRNGFCDKVDGYFRSTTSFFQTHEFKYQ